MNCSQAGRGMPSTQVRKQCFKENKQTFKELKKLDINKLNTLFKKKGVQI